MRNPANLIFRSFAIRDFRWLAGASLLVNTATWMQRITQDWLAIDITGRGTTVGIVTGLQFLPVLLVSPFAGSLADRLPKRWLLTATGFVLAATALVLGGLTAAGKVTPALLYGFALVLGICAAIDMPTRFAYVCSLTDPNRLTNAIGLSGLIFHSARVIGPAIAGLLMARYGVSVAFMTITGCHLIAVGLLYGIAAEERVINASGRAGLKVAAAELRQQPRLLVLMALAAAVCALAMNFQIIITTMAAHVFGLGAGAFGGLSSLMALGSILGALIVSSLTGIRFWMVLGAAAMLGCAYLASFLCRTPWTFGLSLIPIGLLSNFFLATSGSLFQLHVGSHIQGRAIGLYQAASYALVPGGAALIGYAADAASARLPLAVSGVLCLVASFTAAAVLRRLAGAPIGTYPLIQAPSEG